MHKFFPWSQPQGRIETKRLICATGLLLLAALPASAQVTGGILHVNNQHMS